MKKLSLFFVAAILTLGVPGQVFAGRPPETPSTYKLKLIGSVQTGDADIASGGHDVAMIVVACGSTACTATFADDSGASGLGGDYGGDAKVKIEVGAAANSTTVLDLTESPITFSDGILVQDDANVNVAAVYEFR